MPGAKPPQRVFADVATALDKLDRDEVVRFLASLGDIICTSPHLAQAHSAIANACVMLYESSRFDPDRDATLPSRAEQHAREACRLDPLAGEPWSTLAYVLHLQGNSRDAVAAASHAITVEANDWRHYVALAFVSWGEQRLRAAHKVGRLRPGLALTHWLTATVFIARQAFDAALTELRAGCAAQDTQRKDTGRFAIVGLHLLHAQMLAALGSLEEALEELERERAVADERHIYGPECLANVWYSIGAIRLRQGRRDEADAAFRQALCFGPHHPLAAVALNSEAPAREPLAQAAAAALAGNHDEAARICDQALESAPPGDVGWLLTIDPLLQPGFASPVWQAVLRILRDRAT